MISKFSDLDDAKQPRPSLPNPKSRNPGSARPSVVRFRPDKPGPNWLVSSSKCSIPNLDAWHDSIKGYVKRLPPLNCTQILLEDGTYNRTLTYVRSNKLHLTEIARSKGLKAEHCCYKSINRGSDDRRLVSDATCVAMNTLEGFESPSETISITCPMFNYTNVHSFVKSDPGEKAAIKLMAKQRLNQDNYYNVIIVGVDTISRLNGHRQLHRTLKVLRHIYDAVEFNGYNKVGENTFPNLVPLLTGLRPEQLTETKCWPASNYSDESETGDGYLDNCQFLWNYYRELGYTTYFSEDWPKASTFNYLKDGFKSQPTTFYGRPFTIARDSLLLPKVDMGCASCLLDRPLVEVDLENLKMFLIENRGLPHFAFHWINCPQHDDLNGASQVDLTLERFFLNIRHLSKDDRTFVMLLSDHGYRWNDFVSTRIGHYESSLPMLTIAAPKQFIKNHKDYYENLKSLESVLLTPFDLFRTLIDIRNLGMKDSFREASEKTRSRHLGELPLSNSQSVANEKGATNDITNEADAAMISTKIEMLKPVDGLSYNQTFSTISLLKDHKAFELNRSCSEAGIPDNYCVCHEFKQVANETDDVYGAAIYLVYVHLYKNLASHLALCHQLDLNDVVEAELYDFSVRKSRLKSAPVSQTEVDEQVVSTTKPPVLATHAATRSDSDLPNREYNIKFSTVPGDGLFQEIVRYYGDNMEDCERAVREVRRQMSKWNYDERHKAVLNLNEICRFSVRSKSLSRLNLYKNQSKCVKSNIELKKICYCRDAG